MNRLRGFEWDIIFFLALLLLFHIYLCHHPQITDYMVTALCRGIFAGDARKLSVRSCFPLLYNHEQKYGSIIKGGYYSFQEKPGMYFVLWVQEICICIFFVILKEKPFRDQIVFVFCCFVVTLSLSKSKTNLIET